VPLNFKSPAFIGHVGGLDNTNPNAWNIDEFGGVNNTYDPISEGEVNGTINSFAVSPDGTHAYLSEIDGAVRAVHEYSMSVAYSLATLTWVREKNFASTTGLVGPIRFNLDGTKMFLGDLSGDTVDEYALSTAWNISTSSFTDGFDVVTPTASDNFQGFAFNEDGTKLFVQNALNDDGPSGSFEPTIYRYSCSAFDISTCSLDGSQSFEATDIDHSTCDGIEIRDDGTMMWIYFPDDSFGVADITIRQYDMSTPYDLTTMSTTSIGNEVFTNVIPKETLQRCVIFKRDGFRVWQCGSDENLIRQFNSPQ
jgi:hypothetical protein